MKKRILCLLVAVLTVLCTVPIQGAVTPLDEVVSYLEPFFNTFRPRDCSEFTLVKESDTAWSGSGDGKFYVVKETMTIPNMVTVTGTVSLILVNGCTLTVQNGIDTSSADFSVYAQSTDQDEMGTLVATMPDGQMASSDCHAGIGGGSNAGCGSVSIYGGNIIAHGSKSAAGIGGGMNGSGGSVYIYGGRVKADSYQLGAGIGGGENGSCGSVCVYGGFVEANGGSRSAGIGGGGRDTSYFVNNVTMAVTGGSVDIYGGTVIANGGEFAAGIGGGQNGSGGTVTITGGTVTATGNAGAGIGGGINGHGGTVTISDGTVTAVSAYGAGIGGGEAFSADNIINGGTVTVNGGTVSASGGWGDGIGGGSQQDGAKGIAGADVTINGGSVTAHSDHKYGIRGRNITLRSGTVTASCENGVYVGGDTVTVADGTFLNDTTTGDLITLPKDSTWNDVLGTLPSFTMTNAGDVPYHYYDTLEDAYTTYTPGDGARLLEEGTSTLSGWYVAYRDLTFETLTVSKNAYLLLMDGVKITVNDRIIVEDPNTLALYAQTEDPENMGALTVYSGAEYYAGIGSGENTEGGLVSIHGGKITAVGGDQAAGIGGGCQSGASVFIYGGVIDATGGMQAAGIGGGLGGTGNVRILNGDVTALGGDSGGAGIGGGYNGSCSIWVNGGHITATGGSGKRGFFDDLPAGAGIGSHNGKGTVEIVRGTVSACGGAEYNAAKGKADGINALYVYAAPRDDQAVSFAADGGIENVYTERTEIRKTLTGKSAVTVLSFDSAEPRTTGISLTLDSDIFVNFYMYLPEDAKEDAAVVFTIGDRIAEGKARTNENGTFFSCPLNVLEMSETVTAAFSYNDKEYEASCSIADYIDSIVTGAYPENVKTLAYKISNYGHYAQKYLADIHENTVKIGEDGYAETFLYTDADIDLGAAKAALRDNFKAPAKANGIELYARTVYFDSATALNYYVKVEDGTKPTVSCDGKETAVRKYRDNIFIVSILNIAATELGDNFTVTVGGVDFTGSVLDYCGAVMNKKEQTEAAQRAMAAFYEYHTAAKAYADTADQD